MNLRMGTQRSENNAVCRRQDRLSVRLSPYYAILLKKKSAGRKGKSGSGKLHLCHIALKIFNLIFLSQFAVSSSARRIFCI